MPGTFQELSNMETKHNKIIPGLQIKLSLSFEMLLNHCTVMLHSLNKFSHKRFDDRQSIIIPSMTVTLAIYPTGGHALFATANQQPDFFQTDKHRDKEKKAPAIPHP